MAMEILQDEAFALPTIPDNVVCEDNNPRNGVMEKEILSSGEEKKVDTVKNEMAIEVSQDEEAFTLPMIPDNVVCEDNDLGYVVMKEKQMDTVDDGMTSMILPDEVSDLPKMPETENPGQGVMEEKHLDIFEDKMAIEISQVEKASDFPIIPEPVEGEDNKKSDLGEDGVTIQENESKPLTADESISITEEESS